MTNNIPPIYTAIIDGEPITSPDLETVILACRDTYDALDYTHHEDMNGHTVLTLTTEGEETEIRIFRHSFEGIRAVKEKFASDLIDQIIAERKAELAGMQAVADRIGQAA